MDYYRKLIGTVLIPLHLHELRKWLAGTYKPLVDCLTPERNPAYTSTHQICEEYLDLFASIPTVVLQKGKGHAEPYAIFKALLAHPWCDEHLANIVHQYSVENRHERSYNLLAILARAPQGSRLVQKCLGRVTMGHWRRGPVASGYLIGHALKSATLADVKRMLHLCGTDPLVFSLGYVSWSRAAKNPRHDVIKYAITRESARVVRLVEWVTPLEQSLPKVGIKMRRAVTTLLATAITVGSPAHASVYEIVRQLPPVCPHHALSMTIPIVVECCGSRPKGPLGGVMAFLYLNYNTARQAQMVKNVLVDPNWVTLVLSMPMSSTDFQFRYDDMSLSVKKLCSKSECGAFSHGMRALLIDPSFAASSPADQATVVENLVVAHYRSMYRLSPECIHHLLDHPGATIEQVVEKVVRIYAFNNTMTRVRGRADTEIVMVREFAHNLGWNALKAAARLAMDSGNYETKRSEESILKLQDAFTNTLWVYTRLRRLLRGTAINCWKRRFRAISADVSMMPPNLTTCPMGGRMYQSRLVSFTSRSETDYFRPPALPPTPEFLAWYAIRGAAVAPKADGILYQGVFPKTVHPLHTVGPGTMVRAEIMHIETKHGPKNLYMIFDIHAPDTLDETIIERLTYLRKQHAGDCRPDDGFGRDELVLGRFLDTLPALCEEDLWWPKWIGKSSLNNLLRMIDAPPTTQFYKNDGWILTPLASQASHIGRHVVYPPDLKIKPPHEVTADLEFDGVVWRCEWVSGGWVKRESRPEKKRPNPPAIVNTLEAFHKHPWQPRDLLTFVRGEFTGRRPSLDRPALTFLQTQRHIQRIEISRACYGKRVLDVGSGRGRVSLDLKSPASWVGIECDPYNVAEARIRQKDRTWIWADFGTLESPIPLGRTTPELKPSSFDVILFIHSIHHGAVSAGQWTAWLENLTKLAAPGATVYIRTMDPDHLPAGTSELPNGSFVRRLAEQDSRLSGTVEVRSRLVWNGTATVTGNYHHLERLRSDLSGWGWTHVETVYEGMPDGLNELDGSDAPSWVVWATAHVWIILKKM